jgi:small GTP-binding protein
MNKKPNYDFMYKIVIAGDANVGKTTFFKNIESYDRIPFEEYEATLGIDFNVFYKNINDKILKINLWDTAGQERYRSLIKTYLRNAVGYILIFDLNREETFDSIPKWLEHIKNINTCNHNHPILLIGNKSDLKINVKKNRIENLVLNTDQIIYAEISLKNRDNIDIIFQLLIEHIHFKIYMNNKKCCGLKYVISEEESIKLNNEYQKNKNNCCN